MIMYWYLCVAELNMNLVSNSFHISQFYYHDFRNCYLNDQNIENEILKKFLNSEKPRTTVETRQSCIVKRILPRTLTAQ
jgi:hypothetical protein